MTHPDTHCPYCEGCDKGACWFTANRYGLVWVHAPCEDHEQQFAEYEADHA